MVPNRRSIFEISQTKFCCKLSLHNVLVQNLVSKHSLLNHADEDTIVYPYFGSRCGWEGIPFVVDHSSLFFSRPLGFSENIGGLRRVQ